MREPTTGLLLINLGSPDAPEAGPVRRYLAEFLSDPAVIDLPAVWRWLLLHGIILRTRPRRSAQAYQQIWTERGSPLIAHGEDLRDALTKALDSPVVLAMRYGTPSLEQGLKSLAKLGVDRALVLMLYPQEAGATTGSTRRALDQIVATHSSLPRLEYLPSYCTDPGFIASLASTAHPLWVQHKAEHLLLSYHGLPFRQLRKAAPSGPCTLDGSCCEENATTRCYRAQCLATSQSLTAAMGLTEDQVSSSFQSRMGRAWIGPHTDQVLASLPQRGVRRLLVLTPAFAADCLETLEEIGLRGRQRFLEHGGESFVLAPCLNAHPQWVQTIVAWARPSPGRTS